MKKLVLGIAIASVLGLSACDDESIEDAKIDQTVITAPAKVVFNPSDGVLSVPNDLLFQGTLDGTLNIPGAGTEGSDPYFALNTLDGWSTANPFKIALDFPGDTSLDASSVFNPAAVRIFETLMGGSTDPDCAAVPRGAACKVVTELTFGVDFIAQQSGDSVAIVPLKPLKAKTSYLLALTNTIQDDTGRAVEASDSYKLVSQNIADKPLGSPAQLGLQAIINSFENALVAADVDQDSIIYTMAMTTQSTTDVLENVKALLASNASNGDVPSMVITDSGYSVAQVLATQGLPLTAELTALYSTANYLTSTITLPYYSGVPTQENPQAPVNAWWTALCDSGAMLQGLAAANPAAIPETPVDVVDGTCMAISAAAGLAAPGLRSLGIDTERNLTQYNPVPAAKTAMAIPVQLTTPDAAVATALRASFGLPALVEPADGWPVVILQHGITSKKEDMLVLTGMLSLYGFASVAIDHPLHGERGFDLTGFNLEENDLEEINASTVSSTHYMNLGSLLTTRDNLRQSSADLLGLRLGVNFAGGLDVNSNLIKLDSSEVHFLGHSLGAITGINFLSLANKALNPAIDPLFSVATNSLAVPGVMIANFLLESGNFGGIIKSQVTLAQSTDFQDYIAQVYLNGYTEDELIVGFNNFYNMLTEAQQATLNESFAQFTFAAQTVTDAGDPINYVSLMASQAIPTHVIEIIGNDTDNLPDQVIPNVVPTAPLSGTESAIALLGLSGVSTTTQDVDNTVSGAVRYLYGTHGSILDPRTIEGVADNAEKTAAATGEMQRQITDFFSSGGTLISIADETLVQ